jgi:diaminopimelate epimerase
MKFVKMHGAGNDFIIIDGRTEKLDGINFSELAIKLCDRNFGIGADGILLVLPSEKADMKMRVINSDGSEAEMCGNGIRCFTKYLYETTEKKKEILSVETLAGIILPSIIEYKGKTALVEVDMGTPKDIKQATVEVKSGKFAATLVSMGNPHCVIFVDDLNDIKLDVTGPEIETNKMFPKKTNVEFVQVISDGEIKVKVWERGAGETLACGTGACASVVAAVKVKGMQRDLMVQLPGGELDIEWQADDHIVMRGPAESVFEGKLL